MKTVLVTGASRGLGLEFARQYLEDGWHVLAGCRSVAAADSLRSLGIEPIAMDVENPQSVASAAAGLMGVKIDLLLNNAGIMGNHDATPLTADLEEWDRAYRVNVIGPVLVTRAFLKNLRMSEQPLGATLGSQAGIYSKIDSPIMAIYRSTKSAAHAVTLSLAHELAAMGIIYFSLRPGPTKTDMTGDRVPFEKDDSVRKLRSVIASITPDHAGKFMDRSGRIYPYDGAFED